MAFLESYWSSKFSKCQSFCTGTLNLYRRYLEELYLRMLGIKQASSTQFPNTKSVQCQTEPMFDLIWCTQAPALGRAPGTPSTTSSPPKNSHTWAQSEYFQWVRPRLARTSERAIPFNLPTLPGVDMRNGCSLSSRDLNHAAAEQHYVNYMMMLMPRTINNTTLVRPI